MIHTELLEPRRLLAAVYPTAQEQFMVELYNQARADPTWAATCYGVALNEGLPGGTISSTPKQPLAINPLLTDAARGHASWLRANNLFSHTGAGGSQPKDRMAAAGYVFSGSWAAGENAAMSMSTVLGEHTGLVESQFQGLYQDLSVPGRGHRVQMMNDSMKEVGSGIATGPYQGLNGFLSVQNFARSDGSYSGQAFLTGVAYNDSSGNDFYTPGEGLGGVTVTATRLSDSAVFTTTTWSSGGYSLALPAGTYTVTGGGGSLGGNVIWDNVTIGSTNVKRDFRPDQVADEPDFASLNGSTLVVTGTAGSDQIDVSVSGGSVVATVAGLGQMSFPAGSVTLVKVYGDAGDDQITLGAGLVGSYVSAGAGNDTVGGGPGNDTVVGHDGADSLTGGGGSDRLYAGNDNDVLRGGDDDDSLYGQANNDLLFGDAGNDLLDGGNKTDTLAGGAGTDGADYSRRSNPVTAEPGTATNGEANERDQIGSDVENLYGGSGNDSLTGSAWTNKLYGNAGHDTLTATGGKDQLYGGAGEDLLLSRNSLKDWLFGGADDDRAQTDGLDGVSEIEQLLP